MSGKADLFSFQYWFYDLVKLTAAVPGLIFHRPKLLYASRAARKRVRGGAIVASNHVSFSDPIFLHYAIWYRRHHFLCMKHFFRTKRLARLFRLFLCIPVDRENFSLQTMHEIVQHLKGGDLISMFPEGQIGTDADGSVAAYKTGMVLMALQSGVPIIPVYIKKPAQPYRRVVLAIGEPVVPAQLCGSRPTLAQLNELTALLHQREDALKLLCG